MNIVYYLPSGQIVRQTAGVPLSPKPEELWIEYYGTADLSMSYVSNDQVVTMPPRPSPSHYFDYTTKEWVLDLNEAWTSIRAERDRLLAESDWTQLPDVPSKTKEAWAAYRQALRDITEQLDPLNIVWPEPPIK